MKTLYYVLEERLRLGEFPFTLKEFSQAAQTMFDYEEDDEMYKRVQEYVEGKYGEKAWRTLLGWMQGTFYGVDMETLYKTVQNLPLDRIDRAIGAGSFGAVFTYDNDKVIKWYHKNFPMSSIDRRYYEYCLSNSEYFLPKVYRVGKNFVIMEKLNMNTARCKRYDSVSFSQKIKIGQRECAMCWYVKDAVYKGDDASLANLTKLKEMFSSGENKKILQWNIDAANTLKKLKIEYPSDIRLRNIGERPGSKNIVCFDI